jgi:hypothetical protein
MLKRPEAVPASAGVIPTIAIAEIRVMTIAWSALPASNGARARRRHPAVKDHLQRVSSRSGSCGAAPAHRPGEALAAAHKADGSAGALIKLDFIPGQRTRASVRPISLPRGRDSGGDRENCVGMESISIASRPGVAVAALARVLALVRPSLAQAAHGGHGGAGSFPRGGLSIGGF